MPCSCPADRVSSQLPGADSQVGSGAVLKRLQWKEGKGVGEENIFFFFSSSNKIQQSFYKEGVDV